MQSANLGVFIIKWKNSVTLAVFAVRSCYHRKNGSIVFLSMENPASKATFSLLAKESFFSLQVGPEEILVLLVLLSFISSFSSYSRCFSLRNYSDRRKCADLDSVFILGHFCSKVLAECDFPIFLLYQYLCDFYSSRQSY